MTQEFANWTRPFSKRSAFLIVEKLGCLDNIEIILISVTFAFCQGQRLTTLAEMRMTEVRSRRPYDHKKQSGAQVIK